MKKTLKATHEFFYGGKTLKAGEEFQAVDPDANILCVLGKASEVVTTTPAKQEPPPPPPPQITAADLKAEDENENSPPKRRRYMRRDMRAED